MEQLIATLKEKGVLRTKKIIEAFAAVDRADFVTPDCTLLAYEDRALPIGLGQTISQPTVVAFMLELLGPKPEEKILDVGSGSGWTTALLGYCVGKGGKVYGVEIIQQLVAFGRKNIAKYNFPSAKIVQAKEVLGLPEEAPFDKILVSAGTSSVPKKLLEQLAVGGIMVIPIGEAIWKIIKKEKGETEIEKFEGFVFVPLINNT